MNAYIVLVQRLHKDYVMTRENLLHQFQDYWTHKEKF